MIPQLDRPKIPYKSSDPSFTSYEASRLLEVTENKDLKFDLYYLEIASVGSTAREILRMNHANCELHQPSREERKAGKVPTTFSYFPMLKVTFPDGKELPIAEAMVIDVFLAERFGLLGENKFESITIQSFYSNIHYLRERTFSEVADVPDPFKFEAREYFFNYTLKTFLEDHDYHLRVNGSNGHYVGNKLSLADIHLSNIIHYYGTLPWAKMAIDAFKSYEAMWKVKETVDKIPEIVAWRATKEFKKLEEGSIQFYKRCTVPEDKVHEE